MIAVNFKTEYENKIKNWFEFDKSTSIESMLLTFLKENNFELNLNKYTFLFSIKVLNSKPFLNKRIEDVFKGRSHIFIRFISPNSIFAGGGPLYIADTFIKFNDYKDYFITLHKKLSEFFSENYSDLNYDDTYKNNFINFIESMNIEGKYRIIEWINKVNSGIVQEFIQVYTGETPLCYSLNKWLRKCDSKEYDSIKYFAGPFSYSLYKYVFDNSKININYSKLFYRKMVLKSEDYLKYKNNIGELICYPAFTSTSEKDMTKYTFPTPTAIEINNLKSDDIYVVLKIEYKCNNSSYPTPCVNVSYDSVNAGEREFIFPPFSFFKIENVENKSGTDKDPHVIYLSVPNKRILIELAIKNNKTINYDKNLNELFSS